MSQRRGADAVSFQAGATIPAYRIVGPYTTTSKKVSTWATDTSVMIGVSMDDAAQSDAAVALVIGGGSALLQAGASVTVWTGASGQTDTGLGVEHALLAATAAALVVRPMVGIWLESGSTNSVVEVLVRPTNLRFDF